MTGGFSSIIFLVMNIRAIADKIGMDYEGVMEDFCGDVGAVREKLMAFASGNIAESIDGCLGSGDYAGARKFAHSLRKNAEKLGIKKLAERRSGMRKIIIALAIAVAVVLAGCASTGEDIDRTSITISLAENPESGFQWVWGQMGSGHIELADSSMNNTGEHSFTFIGTAPGHVTLTFSAKNMETGTNASQEVYSVTVYDDLTLSYL